MTPQEIEAMTKDRMPVIILGRLFGTASDWDRANDNALLFYDFRPVQESAIPAGELQVDFDTGILEILAEDGVAVIFHADVVDVVKGLSLA